jgi:hypothetical protein
MDPTLILDPPVAVDATVIAPAHRPDTHRQGHGDHHARGATVISRWCAGKGRQDGRHHHLLVGLDRQDPLHERLRVTAASLRAPA